MKTKSGPIVGEIAGREFEVYVTGTEHEFIIESIAYNLAGHEASRVYLTMSEFNLLDYGVFANSVLITGNNVKIEGNLGVNAPSIYFGNVLVDGNITLGPEATPSDIVDAENNIEEGHMVNKLSSIVNLPEVNPADFPIALPNGTESVNTANYTPNDGKLMFSLDRIDISGNSEFLRIRRWPGTPIYYR